VCSGCPDTLLSISVFHNYMQASVRYNGCTSKVLPVTRVVKQECVLAPTLFAIYFSALLLRVFPSTSGVLLHSRSSGKLFNLSRFRARSKGGFTQNPVPAYSPSTVTVRFENRLTCSGMLSHRFRKRPFSRVRLALRSYWVDVH